MARHPLPQSATDTSPDGGVPARSRPLAFLASLRPDQWTKNLIVFAGLIFLDPLLAIFSRGKTLLKIVHDDVLSEDDKPAAELQPVADASCYLDGSRRLKPTAP